MRDYKKELKEDLASARQIYKDVISKTAPQIKAMI